MSNHQSTSASVAAWRSFRGLRDAETEHEKLTVYPWRTPQEVVTRHPSNQLANFTAFVPSDGTIVPWHRYEQVRSLSGLTRD